MSDKDLILKVPAISLDVPQYQPSVLVEIARSFSFKLNMGNYESRDFFCSQKAECRIEDSDRVSEALHAFCKSSVLKAVREYREEAQCAETPHPAAKSNAAEFERRQRMDKPTDDYNKLKERIG